VHTLRADDPEIARANPVDSLDWAGYLDELSRYQSSP
jgi:DNA polymerase-4